MKNPLRIGTRGSPLALAQTDLIVKALSKFAPNVRCEVVPIRTRGDRMQDLGVTALEGKSIFTQEIDESLMSGKIDVAVHSMKDLTTDLSGGLMIAAVQERADPRDLFVSATDTKFDRLPARARIGTSSPRRKVQLLAARGDLEVVDIHGNVGTRLRKLAQGEYDAIVLAAAGLSRLGLEKHPSEYLSTDVMLPAVGQGALAVQARVDDTETKMLVSNIDHAETHRAVDAERAFARRLGASCRTPIAAYARFEHSKLVIDGMVAHPSGKMLVKSRLVSDDPSAEKVGVELAESLLEKGAAAVLEAS